MNSLALTVLLSITVAVQSTQPSTARVGGKVRIVLAGDSTVTDKQGWGPGFKALLRDDVECINLAKGGRSSKSFRNEGLWDQVLAAKPDFVLIQFGHNDEPGKGHERETDADTLAAGATPGLVTALTRRQFRDDDRIIPRSFRTSRS